MYRIPVLLLCLLSVTAPAGSANTLTGTGSTPDSVNTNFSSSDNSTPCEKSADCEELPRPHFCSNGTCYGCYECCALKKAQCPRRWCYCTWFLTDEELKIVAQAVLGVAVFVTCVALLSLLWKMCARRLRRRRVAAAAGVDLLDDAASLSSQQVFVVERLRDRPPRYEDAARDFAVEKPPPYSEAVVVVIGRLVRRSSAEPEADCGTRPPKGLPQPQPLSPRTAPGLSTGAASSEPEPGPAAAAAEELGSPTSTAA
ncbi:uncharacterized protein LOC126109557 [Schistocerca cancellata]|uniref:uncharacterized protein LOC126109557 n=1 Tax=Schistocerca cancellata TaxID=274614 RepID=UPI0021193C9A|nr:uncharacterized protein LOC126109557 [Schistocerca cancellata]